MIILIIGLSVALLLILALLSAYITNPFSHFSVIKRPYKAHFSNNRLIVESKIHKIKIKQSPLSKAVAYLKCGIYILNTRYVYSPQSNSKTVSTIIDDIYRLRFNPKNLLLTSGDHFSSLFVRNLGVFYYPTCDELIPGTKTAWENRQICYLQTVAYALATFEKQKTLTTTIVPMGSYSATCINFYAYPSDTLYGILFALASLNGTEKPRAYDYGPRHHLLQTEGASNKLLQKQKLSLKRHYARYRETAYDEETGLIKTDLHMSGAKDITRRSSSFYDNVIFWKTTELAMRLGIIKDNPEQLMQLKRRILDTFWLDAEGYFLEDLSDEGIAEHYYSSDWLIVLATGFLSPKRASERIYFSRSIDYIQKQKIDQPFAIKYQNDTRAHRQFLAVRLAVASYGGDSIWSFWGMEYIKCLTMLYKQTSEENYLRQADYHINKYKQAMLKNHGYPEVYDKNGEMLKTPFYLSIRQTGWVVGFEQVLAMRENIDREPYA